ncbi:hypothetical protein Ancab_004638 [Ancistrocladus abbreviatus]
MPLPPFLLHYPTPPSIEPQAPGGDSAPLEWALLLVGCLLGLATGLCVAAFNRRVAHGFQLGFLAWIVAVAKILLSLSVSSILVSLHVKVHLMHEWACAGTPNEGAAWLRLQRLADTWHQILLIPVTGGVIVAIQAAVTLGTGCSLAPEGPSVDIGKSCAHGCSVMMENNRESKIALVAAGAAAGIASGIKVHFNELFIPYVHLSSHVT